MNKLLRIGGLCAVGAIVCAVASTNAIADVSVNSNTNVNSRNNFNSTESANKTGRAQAINKSYDKWNMDCTSDTQCVISHKVELTRNNKTMVIGGATVFKSSEHLVLRLRFTSGALKDKGLGLKVDNNKPLHLPITACDKNICESSVAIDDKLLKELKGGKLLLVSFFDGAKRQRSIPVLLKGFTKAFNAAKLD